MRIATWNVNSIRARAERVVDFLQREEIDVLAMQELKCKPEQFPSDLFSDAGWHTLAHGIDQWNGVGFASRIPWDSSEKNFPDQPLYGNPGKEPKLEARCLSIQIGDVHLYSLYVPNGRSLEHPHYQYKLNWLSKLYQHMSDFLTANPQAKIMLMGDWNVAPLDEDVWDIDYWQGQTHVSTPERAAFNRFEKLGFTEVSRNQFNGYTYWDYTKLRFPKNEGMRIDFVYCSEALAPAVKSVVALRDERKGKGASDHIPLIVELT